MEWAARAIGVFYVLGGLMLLHQAWLNWRLQRALSGLMPSPFGERIADLMIAAGGVLVLISGAALMVLSAWAVGAFLAGWGIQAGYLLWAGRWSAPREAIARHGRRRSVHAFAIYTAATGLVMSLPMIGVLG